MVITFLQTRKYKGSADELSRLAEKVHRLRQEIEGQKPENDKPKTSENNYMADIEALKQNLWKVSGEKRAYME